MTPWMDFGTNSEKILRKVSLYGRMKAENGMPQVTVRAQSERGSKERILMHDKWEDKLFARRMRLGGRRFRLNIEAAEGTQFCFTGGVEIETEG